MREGEQEPRSPTEVTLEGAAFLPESADALAGWYVENPDAIIALDQQVHEIRCPAANIQDRSRRVCGLLYQAQRYSRRLLIPAHRIG